MIGKVHKIGYSVSLEDSYSFPDEKTSWGSGDTTQSSILISKSIEALCLILIDVKIEARKLRETIESNFFSAGYTD